MKNIELTQRREPEKEDRPETLLSQIEREAAKKNIALNPQKLAIEDLLIFDAIEHDGAVADEQLFMYGKRIKSYLRKYKDTQGASGEYKDRKRFLALIIAKESQRAKMSPEKNKRMADREPTTETEMRYARETVAQYIEGEKTQRISNAQFSGEIFRIDDLDEKDLAMWLKVISGDTDKKAFSAYTKKFADPFGNEREDLDRSHRVFIRALKNLVMPIFFHQ